MAVGQGGYYTNNLTIATMAYLAENGLVPMDTQYSNGSPPQTLAVPIGLLGAQTQVGNLAVTARAGGGQANATALDYGVNTVTVVATAADSVKLPTAIAGAVCWVKNLDAADSMQVFGSGIDTIDGIATGTGVAQAAGNGTIYVCTSSSSSGVAGTWVRF